MRTLLAFGLVLLLSSSCVGPADRARLAEEERPTDALAPSFTPLSVDTTADGEEPEQATRSGPSPPGEGSSPAPDDDPASVSGGPSGPPETGGPAPSPSSPPGADAAELDDPAGDVTGVGSPEWADLRGARLVRERTTFTLTHVLDGPAPREGDGQNTMNIATFFDIDGDGDIDYEIWANLSPDGWGTSYFDEREGTARYAADDDVDVEVVGGAVQLSFPTSHLSEAASFRWSIASEHGPYQAIGTDAMSRDYLPDDRSGRPFPG